MKTITLEAGVIEAIAGHYEEALRLIEDRFHVRLAARGTDVTVTATDNGNGAEERVRRVTGLLRQLDELHRQGLSLGREDLKTAVDLVRREPGARLADHFREGRIATPTKAIFPRSDNQRRYIEAMREADFVLSIGPAGTGKTYLAVAMAVALFTMKQVQRIILARPAVEAGERLGFLARGYRGQGRSLPAAAVRRAVRHARAETHGTPAGAGGDRDRAAGLHARTDPERLLRHPRRGAELDVGTDEDVPDTHGFSTRRPWSPET